MSPVDVGQQTQSSCVEGKDTAESTDTVRSNPVEAWLSTCETPSNDKASSTTLVDSEKVIAAKSRGVEKFQASAQDAKDRSTDTHNIEIGHSAMDGEKEGGQVDAQKDAQKDAEKDAEKDTEKDTEKDAEKDAEKDTEKDADKDTKNEDESDEGSSYQPGSTKSAISGFTNGSGVSGRSVLAQEYRKKEVVRRRYKQHAQHLRITEDRLAAIEEKLGVYVEPSVTSDTTSLAEPLQAIPELRFLHWTAFKSTRKLDDSRPFYAVDVLDGEPVLFHHLHKNVHHMAAESPPSGSEADNLPLKSIPDRIRINSIPLHEILKDTLRGAILTSQRPLVILRPYKPLLYVEEELREQLSGLEKRWGWRSDKEATESRDDSHTGTDDNAENHEQGASMPAVVSGRPSVTGSTGSRASGDGNKNQTLEQSQTPQAMSELRCLLRFMNAIKPIILEIQRIPDSLSPKTSRAAVLFRDVCFIFRPGQYLFNRHGPHKIWRVLQVTGGRNFLSTRQETDRIDNPQIRKTSPCWIDAYYLDYNGKSFGAVHHQFKILPFEGPRHITDLEVYPADHLANHKELFTKMQERGAEFTRVAQVTHKYFKGRTLILDPKGGNISAASSDKMIRGTVYSEEVESPVIIDFDRTLQFNPKWSPDFRYPEFAEQDQREVVEMTLNSHPRHQRGPNFIYESSLALLEHCFIPGCCDNEHILRDILWDKKTREDFVAIQAHLFHLDDKVATSIPEEEHVLFPNRVFAYVLRSRKWACVPLDCLRDVVKEEENYNALELAGSHKDIVKGLVQTHFAARDREKQAAIGQADVESHRGFDLVRAKGKGLIILLHGAPGVGKTSTAECVAELNGTPLFPITCGDLGVEPIQVEENLDFNFQLAESWGCVLLLDEADVFLAQRGDTDLARNALVSIFLRALEYYSGILFLTTNRVGSIDEAFRSRIHLSLYYPILSEIQTQKIWQGQLERACQLHPDMTMNRDAILIWANNLFKTQISTRKVGWNGRQIRNAMKTAVSLAEYNFAVLAKSNPDQTRRPELEIRFFEVVASASWNFDAYLEQALSMTMMQFAKQHGLRDDTARPDLGKLAMPFVPGGSWNQFPPQQQQQQQQHMQFAPQSQQLFQQQQAVQPPQQFQGGQPYGQGPYGSQVNPPQSSTVFGNNPGPAPQHQHMPHFQQGPPAQPQAPPNPTNPYLHNQFSVEGTPTTTNLVPQAGQWPQQSAQQREHLRPLFGPQS